MEERGSIYTHLMAVWGWRACNRHLTVTVHRLAKDGREPPERWAGRPLAALATDLRVDA